MQHNAATHYLNQQIMTASPGQLVVMLYDRAIRALRDAIRAIEAGDIEARCQHVTRATDIVSHLWTTLDMEKGGEIARNLGDLYRFVSTKLGEINMRNDPEVARAMIGLLEPLAESWRSIAGEAAGPTTRPGTAAPTASTRPVSGGFALSA